MKTKFFSNKKFLVLLYLVFCALIIGYMNGLITDKPITSDAEQNLRMSYHLYNSGVLSHAGDIESPTPSNYREPVPPIVYAIGMYLHPGIDKNTALQSLQRGEHTRLIKQVNFFWIFLLLIGVGYLIFIISQNKFLPFLVLFLTLVYFIRFGNHFDVLHTELPAATLIIWFSSLIVLTVKKSSIPLYFGSGIVLGLLILTKGVFFYLSVFFLLFVFHFEKKENRWLKLSLFTLGALILVGPWIVRNYKIYNEVSLTQRGGAVLHLRAMHNQMTGDEVVGAIYFWGPDLYKDIFANTALGASKGDFEVAGIYQRLNPDHAIDTLAVDQGSPEMAISFYSKSRAEINRLQEVLGTEGNEGPRSEAYKIMESDSKRMILKQPIKHSLLSFVYLWRGIWCFPNSTIPLVNEPLQIYLHNIVNFLAYCSLFVFFFWGLIKNNSIFIALTIAPVTMLFIHAFLTENLYRFSIPAIPVMLVCLTLMFFFLINKGADTITS